MQKWVGWVVASVALVLAPMAWDTATAGAAPTDRWLEVCGGTITSLNGMASVPDPHSLDARATVVSLIWFHNYNGGGEDRIYFPKGTLVSAPAGHTWDVGTYCVGIPDQLPQGQILITKVNGRGVGVFGYAYDPEDPTAPVTITGAIDDRPVPGTAQNNWPWNAGPPWPSGATNHGFLFLAGGLSPGDHTLCLRVTDPKPLRDENHMLNPYGSIGCTGFRVK